MSQVCPFFDAGLARLHTMARSRMLCAFDFDGTLAPIVGNPEQAQLPEETASRLTTLATYAPVAIVTGRSVADIQSRIPVEVDYIIGNHGLEGLPGPNVLMEQHTSLYANWKRQLIAELRRCLPHETGIELEDKRYSLSLHYRHANNIDETEQHLLKISAMLQPPARVIGGKCVLNLLPPDIKGKGAALQKLMQLSRSDYALYVGDDVTDEDVFRLRRADILTVRVEYASETMAGFYLHHQRHINRLLDELIYEFRQHAQMAMRPCDIA